MGDPPQRLQTENLEIGKTKEGRQRLLRLQVSDALYPKLREMFVLTENEASKAIARFSVKLNFANAADILRTSANFCITGTGIRTGGGLIETGKPIVQSFLPFGSTANKKGPNYVVKKGSRSRSQSRPPPSTTSTNTQIMASSTSR